MISFPNAKINLGLNILSKRPDGFHNLSSCFYPIPFSDILEIVESDSFSFIPSGIAIPDEGPNLCEIAYELLKKDFEIPSVSIHLHKITPIGAGLGGGSSDASFTLKMLNDLFELGISNEELQGYAAQLGSDCPFFINNKAILAEGTGDIFSKIEVNLSGKYLVLIYPQTHVSTQEAYKGIDSMEPESDINEVIKKPIESWQELLVNDFEKSIFNQYPSIEVIKKELIDNGAIYASMSGSGSAVYGLFDSKPYLPSTLLENTVWQGVL